MAELAAEDNPYQALEARIAGLVADIVAKFRLVEPVRITEIARLMCLPWPWNATSEAEGGAARAELIALIAVAASDQPLPEAIRPTHAIDGDDGSLDLQPILRMVTESLPQVDTLLQLAQVREFFRTAASDSLGMIAALMRGTEMWIRSSTYPEMAAETVRQLFSGARVAAVLNDDLGFEADQALAVLAGCHAVQMEKLHHRMEQFHVKMERLGLDLAASKPPDPDELDQEKRTEFVRQWNSVWDAESDSVTATVDQIAAETRLTNVVVAAVLDHFQLHIGDWTPFQVVDEFASGNNPLRTHPVIRTPEGGAMLVHDSNIAGAVRESLEQHLKGTSIWEEYQANRGNLLEWRTHEAFARVLPQAQFWDGFEYYIPSNAAEIAPDAYTKKVEGDHLIIQDDVAIIVEDKAVAVSPQSRAGETSRLRRNLADIIKKASDQAGRLQDRIQEDGGIRFHGAGWLDLSHIREIHTVAVSLDDLPGISTATSELVQVGLIDVRHIPWTVSLHDLDLIAMLIDLPAEFLLYLRRRRDPLATVIYTAPDELDLFLYFFERGLYVEPDPDRMRNELPFMPEPTTADRRRYRRQKRTYIATRTDSLDLWYRSNLASANSATTAGPVEPDETVHVSKPSMSASPLRELVAAIQERGSYAWLSIGATLLSGSAATQDRMARIPSKSLAEPASVGRERSVTIPLATDRENGWLLVWMTRPASRNILEITRVAQDYLRAKKYQMSLPRGVVFLYDADTRRLIDVIYDGNIGDIEPRLLARLSQLRPIGQFDKMSHLSGNRRADSRSTRKRSSKGSKRRR